MTFSYPECGIVTSLEGLNFYFPIDIANDGKIEGGWDFRGDADSYLVNVDFYGKRCPAVGSRRGMLSFITGELGASEVTSYDIRTGAGFAVRDVVKSNIFLVKPPCEGGRACEAVVAKRMG